MKRLAKNKTYITGIGISSAIGIGQKAFFTGLIEATNVFDYLNNSFRQKDTSFIGAEINNISFPKIFSKKLLQSSSYTGKVALLTIKEAWDDARLDDVESFKVGLIVGGSNVQQRHIFEYYERYSKSGKFVNPRFGYNFFDSDICGMCSEFFNIQGRAFTVGGASASGNLAIIQAIECVKAGDVDVCIALGSLTDLSYLELGAFKNMGAMGSHRFFNSPKDACRPFDKLRDGFVFGESCGAVVVESENSVRKRFIEPYVELAGWSVAVDGNRNPNPSLDGEIRVIKEALNRADLSSKKIDYVNPHGTGSILGDETELTALKNMNLSHSYINTTKSITGHGLCSSGAVEIIASIIQLKESVLHPCRNLDDPIDQSFNWILKDPKFKSINNVLSLSVGFGGINTAIVLKRA